MSGGKMGKVKSALEIALERAEGIGGLSPEEKEKLEDEEKVMSILTEFYRAKLDANGLWTKLRGSKSSLLRMAQLNLIDSVSLGSLQEEFRARKQAILAIESLREKQNTAMIEMSLNAIESLQREYQDMKEKAFEDLKREVEAHPQLRMQPVRTPDGKAVMQMMVSVDEAVDARMAEFLSEHEEQFKQEFSDIVRGLKEQVRTN